MRQLKEKRAASFILGKWAPSGGVPLDYSCPRLGKRPQRGPLGYK